MTSLAQHSPPSPASKPAGKEPVVTKRVWLGTNAAVPSVLHPLPPILSCLSPPAHFCDIRTVSFTPQRSPPSASGSRLNAPDKHPNPLRCQQVPESHSLMTCKFAALSSHSLLLPGALLYSCMLLNPASTLPWMHRISALEASYQTV